MAYHLLLYIKCLRFGQWEPFQFSSCVLVTQLHLFFFKALPYFLASKMCAFPVLAQDLGTKYAHCYLGVFASWPFQWTGLKMHIYIYIYKYTYNT